MDNKNKYLPVGSVCRLKGGIKNIMVIGFCPISIENGKKMYDYCGCLYPEGMVSSDLNLLFDHSQIEEILFTGYSNDEEVQFKIKLNEIVNTKQEEISSNLTEKEVTIDNSNVITDQLNIPTGNNIPNFNSFDLNQQSNN